MTDVFLLCGPSLSGKSTLCRQMVAAFGHHAVSFDAINEERGLPFGAEGLPAEQTWEVTLETAETRVGELLRAGHPAVVDDTFCFRWLRERFCRLAEANGGSPVILHLDPSRETLRRRYEEAGRRGDRPVLSPEVFDEHLRAFQPPGPDEPAVSFVAHEQAMAWLRRRCLPR